MVTLSLQTNPAPSRSSVDSDVKDEELHIKIQENERLQRQVCIQGISL
jgi:hypothetical protein